MQIVNKVEPEAQPEDQEHLYRRTLAGSEVPAHLHEGLVEYLINHHRPGSFLTAVLSNNLSDAVRRGDAESKAHLAELVQWLYWYAPLTSWGDEARVAAWLQEGRS